MADQPAPTATSTSMAPTSTASPTQARAPPCSATAPPASPSPTPPPAGPDLLRVRVAEDAYQGHAQFRVAVDGRALGSPAMAFAAHAAGEAQDFLFAGDFGPGQHRVEVTFLNDAYGGSAATDRNLYLLDVSLDGKSYLANPTSLLSTGQTAEILVQNA